MAAGPGVYTVEDRPADGEVVHAMEHGYVVIWYVPDLPARQVEALRRVAARYRRDVLVVPRPGMPVPLGATAWHRRLLCQEPDTAALEGFVAEFRNKGPERIPH